MDQVGLLFLAVFSLSLLAGRLAPVHVSRTAGRLLQPVVVALIFTISMWAGSSISGLGNILALLGYSMAYSTLSIALSYLSGMLIGGFRSRAVRPINYRAPITYAAPLLVGWFVGMLARVNPPGLAIDAELYTLALLVGLATGPSLSLGSIMEGGRVGLLASVSSIIGSAAAGLALSRILGVRLGASLAIALGMGWYTYTGPTVALYEGPMLGAVAFLANFMREQLTFIIVPMMPGNPESLISIGGATSMDDTLPVYISALGYEYMAASVSSGLLLTILVPFMVQSALLIGR